MPCRIHDIRPGQSARIVGYEGGRSNYRTRLLTMGLTRGTEITLVRVAPLGDPVDIRVRGFSISLRKDEAAVLQLECPNGAESHAAVGGGNRRRGRAGEGRRGPGRGHRRGAHRHGHGGGHEHGTNHTHEESEE
ncbi:MAG: ferrous iron transport protein A [Spirochaetaceae bacterium]